ncbi:MAG: shikimate dehydrogenase [Gammaproteobacteria bacterium]|nr:shikimate dehydrogenase [Gammaproteobacteria bacterium]
MDRYAVLGWPAAHSKSPPMQRRFAEQTGQRMTYEAIEIRPEALADALKRFHAEGWKGFNITLPHKLAVVALCERVSARACIAGAANCLLRTEAGWSGDNTDGEGLIRDLHNQGMPVRGRRVLVLGAGGAARGVLKPLLDEKPAELTLSSRNPWKPEEIAQQFKPYGAIRPCTHLALKGDRYDLIVNATSAGHSGQIPRLPGQLVAEGGACYDLSYGTAFEPFRAWAQEQHAEKIADGLGMLVEQGAASFELWRGMRPQTADVIRRLRAGA